MNNVGFQQGRRGAGEGGEEQEEEERQEEERQEEEEEEEGWQEGPGSGKRVLKLLEPSWPVCHPIFMSDDEDEPGS